MNCGIVPPLPAETDFATNRFVSLEKSIMQKSFRPSFAITRSGRIRYSSSGSRVPAMMVDTSAIVRRYWTFDSRFVRVSSRARRRRSTCARRSSRSRIASRSVATDRSCLAEIASASGAMGPVTDGSGPSVSCATALRSRSTCWNTVLSRRTELATARTNSPAAAPASKTPGGVEKPPRRREAAPVNARRPHQASANRTRHPERSGKPLLRVSSPSGMRRNYHESPLPETEDSGASPSSSRRFIRTPPRW